ncbi:hypothetical protein LUZ60_013027 [Juncus effusus]|nr:hypothetical protein LUZ60_013027 [Juncus effusus]
MTCVTTIYYVAKDKKTEHWIWICGGDVTICQLHLIDSVEILLFSSTTSSSVQMDLRLGKFMVSRKLLAPRCSDQRPPPDKGGKNDKGDGLPTDWDKAWTKFRKKSRKTLFSQFNPDKYVSWNPRRSEYPLSEETDPIKRTERSNLELWTSPRFTLVGAILIVSLLLIYTLSAPMK